MTASGCPRTIPWAFAGLLALASTGRAQDGLPQDSRIRGAALDCQRLLLNPMDDTASVATGAWKMKGTYVAEATDITPKLGATALTLGCAEAEQAGAKGDFRVHETVPGETRAIGLWAHLAKDANVARVGIQVYDSEGEALSAVVPAEWEGWKWIEVDLADTEQAYPQSDKNQAADCPLKSVHVVWFSKSVGPSSLAVDAVIASTRLGDANGSGVDVDSSIPESVDSGAAPAAFVCATNFSEQPARVTVRYSLQRDAALFSQPLPDPVFGSDHAAGTRSWLVVDGETIDDSRGTDGKPWTAPRLPGNGGTTPRLYNSSTWVRSGKSEN